jgi:hypothetical protein
MRLVTLLALLLTATVATAAILVDEQDLGNGYKMCIYDDGSAFTVKDFQLCPLSH